MRELLLPAVVAAFFVAQKQWPTYVSDNVAYGIAAALLLTFLAERYTWWFKPYFVRVAFPLFLMIAGLTSLKGVEDGRPAVVGVGASVALVALVVVFRNEIRDGSYRGFRLHGIFFAAVFGLMGVISVIDRWDHDWPNYAIAATTVPLCVTFVLGRPSNRYWGACFSLTVAASYVAQLEHSEATWLALATAILGTWVFLSGTFEPAQQRRFDFTGPGWKTMTFEFKVDDSEDR
jgi:surface polysaccharide O-acyltransferase-like enzyme